MRMSDERIGLWDSGIASERSIKEITGKVRNGSSRGIWKIIASTPQTPEHLKAALVRCDAHSGIA